MGAGTGHGQGGTACRLDDFREDGAVRFGCGSYPKPLGRALWPMWKRILRRLFPADRSGTADIARAPGSGDFLDRGILGPG
jgi:hypothetical protein